MNELERIRAEYANRERDPRLRGRYSLFRPGTLFTVQDRERRVLRLLERAGYEPLDSFDVLEVGCGAGGVMLDLLRWGAEPDHLYGCDLLPDRLIQARRRLPLATHLSVANGGSLPYTGSRFDLVFQFTVFTSILEESLRREVAREMWRVLRPGGTIVWYDFRFQGRNTAVRAIWPRQVKQLFPQGVCRVHRVTLAPPLARRLAGWSWLGCELLAGLPWLRTHDLILILKMESRDD